MSNLKVNSKTSILEFKRKHNELVDSSSIKINTSNIESLSDVELSSLKCGDIVCKKTGNQEHCYIVTYKEENHGICLSYFDCGYLETISYDYIEGHWIFNSKDVCNIEDLGGTKLYKHSFNVTDPFDNSHSFVVVTTKSSQFTSFADFLASFTSCDITSCKVDDKVIIMVLSGVGCISVNSSLQLHTPFAYSTFKTITNYNISDL